MEENGVIERITEPIDWCAPMVPVMKRGGGVRICVDLKKLNRAVKREREIHAPDPRKRHAQTQRFHSLHDAGRDVGLLATSAGQRDGKADHIHDAVWPVLLSPPAFRNLVGPRSVPENSGEHSR